MKLVFKLFAGLGEYLPADAKENATLVDINDNDSVFDVIAKFNIPPEMIHLVLLNGVYLHPEERITPKFTEGDTLAIWPPIAGG
ncbi:MAG: sulfur carrier protein ThiS [Planctomycetota bacterium]|jgi:sulfur carrier protein ThiS